ncbi:hypothetical protein L1O03_06390 [Corynebacterium uropygiale]|uniref:Uncharacterized protein n=1 Tax=Corynebacterium uropygiale TaxID=1775911 RepID=A0A9X1QS66_9CORY|nr:hypothetical protein [Corynebacterium uropygiale]MCF4006808.1 hypothetical protein [Corynebacterium uropygiale]
MSRKNRKKSAVKVKENPLGLKLKSTCCRKNPRCINCPVVYQRLARSGAWERDDMNLPRELKRARKW